jgi:hypothetical protein
MLDHKKTKLDIHMNLLTLSIFLTISSLVYANYSEDSYSYNQIIILNHYKENVLFNAGYYLYKKTITPSIASLIPYSEDQVR